MDAALIDTDRLTTGELAWLNAYHARVRAEIGPLVDGAATTWLEAATRPLG